MLAIRSKNAVSAIGPAVDSRLKTPHSTRSARGVAAFSRSSGSASHQRSGSISVRRRWVGRPSSSRMSASRRSTGSGSASRSPAWRRVRLVAPGGDAADSGRDAGDGPLVRAPVGRLEIVAGCVAAWRATIGPVVGGGIVDAIVVVDGHRRRGPSSMAGRSSSDRRSSASSPPTPVGARPGARVALASRRSCPARSSPTRISPSSRSKRAGSPRARSVSTAVSVTVRAASAAENGRRSKRSGGANRPLAGTRSGSPAPPGSGSRPTFARVRGPGGRRPPGGSSSTMAAASSSGSDIRALSSR